MVLDNQGSCESHSAAIKAIAPKTVCGRDTLRRRVQQEETDLRCRHGVTLQEPAGIKKLERETRQLRQAKESLKKASMCLTPPPALLAVIAWQAPRGDRLRIPGRCPRSGSCIGPDQTGCRSARRGATCLGNLPGIRPSRSTGGARPEPAPNTLRVLDFTYLATWSGLVQVAFVIEAFARRIVGRRVSCTAHAGFVLDAPEQAVHQREPGAGLAHRSDHGSHDFAIRCGAASRVSVPCPWGLSEGRGCPPTKQVWMRCGRKHGFNRGAVPPSDSAPRSISTSVSSSARGFRDRVFAFATCREAPCSYPALTKPTPTPGPRIPVLA